MRLSEIKPILNNLEDVSFKLPNGKFVAAHFHVTEVGQVIKNYIDCGGTVRQEKKINFQLWEANDFDHRLKARKLLQIISLSETTLEIEDAEIEVEYQDNTIGKYNLQFNNGVFELTNTQTACLAQDQCGIPVTKQKMKLSDIAINNNCKPGSGCC